jgi:hypothetical protein
MLQSLLKFVVLLAIIIAIPILWWQSVTHFSGIKPFLISTGFSLFLLGLCYKLMGTWDLIPDWLPLIGGMDDSVAWIFILIGAVIGGGGFFI